MPTKYILRRGGDGITDATMVQTIDIEKLIERCTERIRRAFADENYNEGSREGQDMILISKLRDALIAVRDGEEAG